MSLQGKQTPLQVNFLSGLLTGTGVRINPQFTFYAGVCQEYDDYTPGTLITGTVLKDLVTAVRKAYLRYKEGKLTEATYNQLLSIGSSSIPALGNSKPSTYIFKYEKEIASFGFVKLLALQAYTEMEVSSGSFSDFCNSFIRCSGYINRMNPVIASLSNSSNHLEGIYSNINDLSSLDITGVNLATVYWGQDLINTGKAIDLANIDKFGMPSVLLKTLQKYGGLSKALTTALILAGFNTSELSDILGGATPTVSQEKKMYVAYQVIQGIDLEEILVALNTQTPKLTVLADLLDPKKLFPTSFGSLTTPRYNETTMATNSKTYYFIYEGGGVNSRIYDMGFKDPYLGILPNDIATACGAFSNAMMQIKKIKTMKIEKFSQVVANMETMKDLGVNGTSTPVDNDLVSQALTTLALGTGPNSSYTMCDFYGAMAGIRYRLAEMKTVIIKLQTTELEQIYSDLLTYLNTEQTSYDAQLLQFISDANTEILNISLNNKIPFTLPANIYTQEEERTDFCPIIANQIWEQLGHYLTIEIRCRVEALADEQLVTGNRDIINFSDAVANSFAFETGLYQSAHILENILDINTLAGNAGIALMRESRNAMKVTLMGGALDNDIDNTLPKVDLPNPLGLVKNEGLATTPGSLASSPERLLIPDNLDIIKISAVLKPSTYTPKDATIAVTDGNCSCWE